MPRWRRSLASPDAPRPSGTGRSTGRTEIRVLSAFDRARRAILLVGGDKSERCLLLPSHDAQLGEVALERLGDPVELVARRLELVAVSAAKQRTVVGLDDPASLF